MRHAWLVLSACLACACAPVDSTGPVVDTGCVSSTTYSSAARTFDLSVNDTSLDTTGGLRLAQSFLVPGTIGTTIAVSSISLPLYSNATLGASTITLQLFTDSGAGTPSAAISGSTVTLLNTAISTTMTLVQFTLSTIQNLVAGATYWIVLDTNYIPATTPVLKWAADDYSTGNTSIYAGGHAKYEYDGTPNPINTFGYGNLGSGRQLGFVISCD